MDAHKNPNLETTHNHHHHPIHTISLTSSQDFKRTHEEFFIKETSPSSEEPGKMVVEENGRERLKRHRVEMSGRVWIPDIWGQEDMLKSWIDSTVFDSSLEKSSIMSARKALIQGGRSALRIRNSC